MIALKKNKVLIFSRLINIEVFTIYLLELADDLFFSFIALSKQIVRAFISERSIAVSKIQGRHPIVSSATEVLIFLLHLKHYPVNLFLGIIFKLSREII
jgi:hypothetical protein